MAVNAHLTTRIAPPQRLSRPAPVEIIIAFSVILTLTVISARLNGWVASGLVLGVGTGALMAGLCCTRSPVIRRQSSSSHMLSELCERVQVQGRMPPLPTGWRVEASTRAARHDRFAGDFVIGNRSEEHRFEVALVDVSGDGVEAGSRSMLMGGAVSGLLGPVAPGDFLPAANDYLVRQGWSEGFATAIHVCLDLSDGRYSVGSAGHPAAVHFRAATRTWTTVEGATGTCLGVLDGQIARDYPRVDGVLAPGDALLLYSDGMVERRDLDLSEGLRQVLDAVDVPPTSVGVADRMCAAALSGDGTDRTVVMLSRD